MSYCAMKGIKKSEAIIWYSELKPIHLAFLKRIGFKTEKRKSKNNEYLYMNVIFVPVATGLFLISYLILQFLGERLDFSPVISLSGPSWVNEREAGLLFVVIIALAQIVALNLTFYLTNLLKKMESDKQNVKM